jgi:hypothetical protein
VRSILLALVLATTAGACGANGADCDKACRNYFTLHYWDEADREIAKAPPDQRDALRRKKVEELDPRMQGELNMCVSQCREAAGNKEAKCMIEAKTVKDVEACVPPGGQE